MHRFRATYLGAFILGWLLSFGSYSAWGYNPPLQATATYDDHSVTYTVFNPQKAQGYSASHNYLATVVTLQQHNGVIAWVVQDGADYSVNMVTFDPALNTFQNAWQGPFSMVSLFQVVDGVVAYSFRDSSLNVGANYATYDPVKGAWQNGVFFEPGAITVGLLNKDGVVVYRFFDGYDNFKAAIYEPQWGKWSAPLYSGANHYLYLYINNATIYCRPEGFEEELFGYYLGGWDHITTVPFAYFVAQPKLGSSPLWVWFTDMSIAGTNWNWNFGDNTTPTSSRSPHHTFTSPGSYQVSQQINGPSTYSQTIIVGYPSTFKGKGLPAILSLLLLAD